MLFFPEKAMILKNQNGKKIQKQKTYMQQWLSLPDVFWLRAKAIK